MKKASYCIYSTEALEQDYQIKYPHPGKSKSLYVSSSLKPAVVCDKNNLQSLLKKHNINYPLY